MDFADFSPQSLGLWGPMYSIDAATMDQLATELASDPFDLFAEAMEDLQVPALMQQEQHAAAAPPGAAWVHVEREQWQPQQHQQPFLAGPAAQTDACHASSSACVPLSAPVACPLSLNHTLQQLNLPFPSYTGKQDLSAAQAQGVVSVLRDANSGVCANEALSSWPGNQPPGAEAPPTSFLFERRTNARDRANAHYMDVGGPQSATAIKLDGGRAALIQWTTHRCEEGKQHRGRPGSAECAGCRVRKIHLLAAGFVERPEGAGKGWEQQEFTKEKIKLWRPPIVLITASAPTPPEGRGKQSKRQDANGAAVAAVDTEPRLTEAAAPKKKRRGAGDRQGMPLPSSSPPPPPASSLPCAAAVAAAAALASRALAGHSTLADEAVPGSLAEQDLMCNLVKRIRLGGLDDFEAYIRGVSPKELASVRNCYDEGLCFWLIDPTQGQPECLQSSLHVALPLDVVRGMLAAVQRVVGDARYHDMLMASNRCSSTIIHKACRYIDREERVPVLEFLLDHVSRVAPRLLPAPTGHCFTPMHAAARDGMRLAVAPYVRCMERLLGRRELVQKLLFDLTNRYYRDAGGDRLLSTELGLLGYELGRPLNGEPGKFEKKAELYSLCLMLPP